MLEFILIFHFDFVSYLQICTVDFPLITDAYLLNKYFAKYSANNYTFFYLTFYDIASVIRTCDDGIITNAINFFIRKELSDNVVKLLDKSTIKFTQSFLRKNLGNTSFLQYKIIFNALFDKYLQYNYATWDDIELYCSILDKVLLAKFLKLSPIIHHGTYYFSVKNHKYIYSTGNVFLNYNKQFPEIIKFLMATENVDVKKGISENTVKLLCYYNLAFYYTELTLANDENLYFIYYRLGNTDTKYDNKLRLRRVKREYAQSKLLQYFKIIPENWKVKNLKKIDYFENDILKINDKNNNLAGLKLFVCHNKESVNVINNNISDYISPFGYYFYICDNITFTREKVSDVIFLKNIKLLYANSTTNIYESKKILKAFVGNNANLNVKYCSFVFSEHINYGLQAVTTNHLHVFTCYLNFFLYRGFEINFDNYAFVKRILQKCNKIDSYQEIGAFFKRFLKTCNIDTQVLKELRFWMITRCYYISIKLIEY